MTTSKAPRSGHRKALTAADIRALAHQIALDIHAMADRAGAEKAAVLKMLAAQTAIRMEEMQPGAHMSMVMANAAIRRREQIDTIGAAT